jgi:HAD superfamily hydrolase (TIGR01509 family)
VPIRAILFDFDGLILDTEYPEYQSWREVFAAHGCELSETLWASNIGRGTSTQTFDPYDELSVRTGRAIDRDTVRAVRRRRFAELMEGKTALPGVEAALDEARRLELRLAVVSSSPREWVTRYLLALDLHDRFHLLRCGDEVARAKPDPELYHSALETLDVRANEALALEDSPNGVLAATRAGIYCVAVPNALTRHACLDAADLCVPSLAEWPLARLIACGENRTDKSVEAETSFGSSNLPYDR